MGLAVQMTTEQTVSRCARLSSRLSVEITAGAAGMTVEWVPAATTRLTTKELAAYRKARSLVLEQLAQVIGSAVVVVEA